MSAAGGSVSQMFYFSGKRMTTLLEKDGPAGPIHKCLDSGWKN